MKNKPSSSSKITLDDLARMMKRQFDGIDDRFDKIDRRFDTLEAKVDTKPSQHHVDSRFKHIEDVVIAKINESSIIRERMLNDKTNAVARKLKDKKVFTNADVQEIAHISPVAVSPTIAA